MELKVGRGIGAAKSRDGRVLLWVGDKIWHISYKEANRLKQCLLGTLEGWTWNERKQKWSAPTILGIAFESSGGKTAKPKPTRSRRKTNRRPVNGRNIRQTH